MLGIILISFVLRNFWCRYLCPYGGLLGLLALISPFQIKRNPETCIDCKKCERVCPSSIHITKEQQCAMLNVSAALNVLRLVLQRTALLLQFPEKKKLTHCFCQDLS